MADASALKGVKRELLTASKDFQNRFLDKLEALPKYEIDCAREKRTKTEELIYELKHLLKMAEEAFDAVRDRLKECFKSDENKEGLLTLTPSEYYDCLKLDKIKFNELFDKEKKFWDKNLQEVEERVTSVESELMGLIETQ